MTALALGIGALWLHFFWCLVPSWRFGEYYSYGFFVVPLSFAFAWRRAATFELPMARPPGSKAAHYGMVLFGMCMLLLLVPIRIVEIGDLSWRPPLILHGLLITAFSHCAVALFYGWKSSASLIPVTLFAWSAVPYPGQIEQSIVRHLTGGVISLTREIFILSGAPVEQMGERLTLGHQIVEVSDGCSGIRSIQSLVMAAIFFGELQLLGWGRRAVLILAALVAAVICNTGRAWYLANVQFNRGVEAGHEVHDMAGHLAFITACLMLFSITWILAARRPGYRVTRRTVAVPSILP